MSDQGVTLSAAAAAQINTILQHEDARFLRVSVVGGGCSGFSYRFDLERVASPDDLKVERDGATVLIDPVSIDFLQASEIDYVDELIGAAFTVKNPNATAACGCGVSFSI